MDAQVKKDVINKSENASFISKLFFCWMIPLFRKGNKKELTVDELYNVPKENESEFLTEQLEKEWDIECLIGAKQCRKPKLLTAFLKAFGRRYASFVLIFILDGWIVRVSQPIFLRLLILSFTDEHATQLEQCLYGAGVCLSTLLHILLNHPTAFQMCVSGMKCRVAVSSLIYKKALRLSKGAQVNCSVGQMVNLLSGDAGKFDYNLYFIAYIFVCPVQLIIFAYILWTQLGISSLAGVGVIVLLSPSQFIIGKLSAKFRMEIAKYTDERSKIMSEIVGAMRLIKMQVWESAFTSLINKVREFEVKALKKRSYLRASFMGVFTSNFTYIPFLALITYGLTGNYVTPDKAFFAVAIFNVMTENMMYYVPNAAALIGELISSIKRIEQFLLADEHKPSKNLDIVEHVDKSEWSISMNNLTAGWNETNKTLENLNIDAKGNSLTLIVGSVGSGKSSILQMLLGELCISSGKCSIRGKISYSCQEAWLFPGTIRQNITFGKEFYKSRYEKVVQVACLEQDFIQLPQGDETYLGEKGLVLSGGQKARVNLARSLYQEADIYLLDDPLSAVDSKTSRHIFEKCIKEFLNDKLIILVTHQLQYLSQADHIIVLDQGKILAQGKYNELVEQGIDIVTLLDDDKATDSPKKKLEATEEAKTESTHEEKEFEEMEKEEMIEGSVTGKTYWNYFRAGDSICGIIFLILSFTLTQILITCTDLWLSKWTITEEQRFKVSNLEAIEPIGNNSTLLTSIFCPLDHLHFIYIYAGLATSVFIVDTIRTIYFFAYCMRMSNNIHKRMLTSLVKSPIKFFDDNPSDMSSMDEFLPAAMFDSLHILLLMIGVLIIVIVANYYLAIPSAILLIAYSLIRNFFVKTSRNIKRLESVCRSPIYTHLSASVQGLSTIRSSKAQHLLIKQFDQQQDIHSSAWYVFLGGNNWFSIWLEFTSTIFIVIVTYSFIIFSNTSFTSSANVGLAISCLLQLMNTFQFGMRQSAEVVNYMTAVERTLEYTKLEPEAATELINDKKLSKYWPESGKIDFNQMTLSYKAGNSVLKNLTFTVKSNEKIAVVGRTGAGKTSIIAALFRMTEPTGEILIDGIKTKDLGLHTLRKSISIIPQDPVLFSGTIRYNLDPFNEYSDEDLWKVLENVKLKELIPALDYSVCEGGQNFSVGERQLICLARALLRRNKILVLDEISAACDLYTDSLIQQTVRKKFSNCTIITIAHRLHTIMDSDRIIVMDDGYVKEYDHPHMLLQNPNGYLSKMVAQLGNSSETKLRKVAAENYYSVGMK